VIEPLFADDAFLENLSKMEASSGDRVVIAWLGQSGYLVCHKGFRFLIDPYLSDSLTRKYAETTKPHERVSRMVITPERLTGISFVTSSHNHTDHLDGETLAKLIEANPDVKVIVPRANCTFALDRLVSAGVANTATYLVAIPVDETLTMSDVHRCTITAVPAAHEALDTDENGDYRYHGYCITIGGKTIYHSGDCVPYAGLVDAVAPHHPDVALLPINGRDPSRGVSGNFSGPEAAALAQSLGVKHVIPNHYDLFAFNTADPQEFVDACEATSQPYKVLRLGEAFVL
jgi:L-ascorbate metabolism protein UlaG (beta-lactamase superfamily)